MRKRILFSIATVLFMASLFLTISIEASSLHRMNSNDSSISMLKEDEQLSWIVKWKQYAEKEFIDESDILIEYPNERIVVARPAHHIRTDQWLEKWSQSADIEYFQVNGAVQVASTIDQAFQGRLNYLELIGLREAWTTENSNTRDIIAIVDTGIDLQHPDLVDQLVPGINLLDRTAPPQDDHGHGTNVAGVVAAKSNYENGTSGILWNAKIMPIKTMYANGTGSEATLGEGIRYAVDNGARIVVLSLGLNKYTPYMAEIINYAEEKGVLLVAAVGNEGNVVKYPAAYPTVLAVGGIKADKSVDRRSNTGPELDLVAPFTVYTTKLNAGYEYKTGSSMAAPQVAAVAAMIWMQQPDLKPYELRSLLRQSAEKLDALFWDSTTGYGLLRADQALAQSYRTDMFESNDTREDAKTLPIGKLATASISSPSDVDWYQIEAPYRGTIEIHLDQIDNTPGSLQLHYYRQDELVEAQIRVTEDRIYQFDIEEEVSYIRITSVDQDENQEMMYSILPLLNIYRDAFEDNDRQYTAHRLPLRNQTITGTFHKESDQDWYLLSVPRPGLLRVSVSTDTARMDPVLLIQKKHEEPLKIHDNGDGETEISPIMEVLPGEYFIRVSNVEEYIYPVLGEYTLNIEYAEKAIDPNEPNDKYYQATSVSMDTYYDGAISDRDDMDWFRFKLEQESTVDIRIDQISPEHYLHATIMDSKLNVIDEILNDGVEDYIQFSSLLEAGDYYINLSGLGRFLQIRYGLQITSDTTILDFTDIEDHWAYEDIAALAELNIIQGYDDQTFRPDNMITRAEAVHMMMKSFNENTSFQPPRFTDVNTEFWAYDSIARAAGYGLITGYPDGTFRPNQPITREEMIVLILRQLNVVAVGSKDMVFTDVEIERWSAGYIHQAKSMGLITGYASGSYQPEHYATRAEFVTLVRRALK